MGLVGALDATATGKLAPDKLEWRTSGFQGGFASPVTDGERLYQVDNGAVLGAFELASGQAALGEAARHDPEGLAGARRRQALRRAPRTASSTSSSRPRAAPEILDEDQLGTRGGAGGDRSRRRPSPAAASTSRRWTRSTRSARRATPKAAAQAAAPKPAARRRAGEPAVAQLVPSEVAGEAGRDGPATTCGSSTRRAASCARSRPRRCALEGLKGAAARPGASRAAADGGSQAGLVKATVGALSATARVRVVPPLPWSFDFEAATGEAPPPYWINSTGKFYVRDHGGSQRADEAQRHPAHQARPAVLRARRLRTTTPSRRTCSRPRSAARWATAASSRSATRSCCSATRRSSSCSPGRPNPARTVEVPFAWKPETWYRVKLRVENQARRHDRGARQGLARRRARAGGVDDRPRRQDAAPAGRAGHLRRRVGRGLLRQRQGHRRTSEEDCSRAHQPLPLARARRAHCRRRAAQSRPRIRAAGPSRRLADVGRHADPQHGLGHEGLPRSPGTSRPRRTCAGWRRSARRATATRWSSGGKVFVGTNNEGLRDPKQAGDRGVLMAFDEKDGEFLWQITHEKLAVGPRQRLALPGRRVVAARRGRPALLRLQPLRADGRSTPRASATARTTGRSRTRSSRASTTATSSGSST